MISIFNPSAEIVTLNVNGLINKDDILSARGAIESALDTSDRISILVDITEFDDATSEAIAEDIKAEFALMGELSRIAKLGLVTDKNWVGTLVHIFADLLDVPVVKVFAPHDKTAATEWVQTPIETAVQSKSTVETIDTGKDGVFAFAFHGKLTKHDIDDVVDQMEIAFASYDKIDLMIDMQDFKGFELGSILDDELWAMKKSAFTKVRRYAVVGAPTWMGSSIKLVDQFIDMEVRAFDAGPEALDWLYGQNAV